jgi:tripartite-type tricarboxylate transporter receptor subunit TctC
MAKALADPALRETFTKGAVEPMGGSAEEMGKLARTDSEKYAKLVKELSIKSTN